MKLLYTSDIHADVNHLTSMFFTAQDESVDAVIVGGDLIPHHLPNERQKGILKAQETYLKDIFLPFMKTFKEKSRIGVYLDMANDDFACNRTMLERYNNDVFHLLHMRKYPLTETVDVIGYMNVPPTPFNRKDWEKPDTADVPFSPGNTIHLSGCVSSDGMLKETTLDLTSEDTIENDLRKLSEMIERPFIFVSHTPPYKTPLDVIYNGLNVGSLGVRHFIEKWSRDGRLIASLHGHIHESPNRSGEISTRINDVLCINPGQESGRHSVFRYVILQLSGSDIEIVK